MPNKNNINRGVFRSVFPKPLSEEETNRYIELMEQGSKEAFDKLVEHNLRLVAMIARKYEFLTVDNPITSMDDLISIGTIGLIKGIQAFNINKGIKLTTYTSRCIENEILIMLRSKKRQDLDVSLDTIIGADNEGNELTIQDTIASDTSFEEDYIQDELYKAVRKSLKSLTDDEKKLIFLRYELYLTQKVTAEHLGISISYVSRKEKKVLKKLAQYLENEELFFARRINDETRKVKNMELTERILYLTNIFINSNITLDRLAAKYDVSTATINQYFKNRLKDINMPLYEKTKSTLEVQTLEKQRLKAKKKIKDSKYKMSPTKSVSKKLDEIQIESNILSVEFLRNKIKELIYMLNDPIERTVLLYKLGYNGQFFTEAEIAIFLGIAENEIHSILYSGLYNLHNIPEKNELGNILRYSNHY